MVTAVAVVATAGGALGAAIAVSSVASGVAASSTAATVAASAFIASTTTFTASVISAASSSDSLDDFAAYGESAFIQTATTTVASAAYSYATTPRTCCFVAGTLILTDDGKSSIEEIQVGDYVWAWDEETGSIALKCVEDTFVRESTELVHIYVNGEKITTTPEHPFYNPVKGWTNAVHLRAGDILVLVNGGYVVVEKIQHELLETPVKVYNFQVEDYHTYYVSGLGVLVHNSCNAPKNKNPLEDITYTNKVKNQMTLDDNHGFPDVVDNYGAYGTQTNIVGGDGQTYTRLVIPGSYKGQTGEFEYIWNSKNICNHRFFQIV